MKRTAFYLEIIVEGERKNLDDDTISTVLKSWQKDLKMQIFKNEGIKIKICAISQTKLKDNGNRSMREDAIYRQTSDPLLTTF